MSFTTILGHDITHVEPGTTVPVDLVIHNRAEEADRIEIEIEGLDADWTAVPVPVINLSAEESQTAKIFLKPPRVSESSAGTYPYVVRLRSLLTGETKSVQGVLQVKPFHHLMVEINPKKGYISPMTKQNVFGLSVMNLGNTEHTVQLTGGDPEDACTFEFDSERLTVGPGQQKELEFDATPKSSRIFGASRLIGYGVTARSADVPSVVTTGQAQLEQRSILSPGTLVFMTVIGILIGSWLAFLPKTPSLTFSVSPVQVVQGETINVRWKAENAKIVIIKANDAEIYRGTELEGERSVPAAKTGAIELSAVAVRDGARSTPVLRSVAVNAPPQVPKPKIFDFVAKSRSVKKGEDIIFSYRVNPATKRLFLSPTATPLPLSETTVSVKADSAGTITYTLIAEDDAGHSDKKSVTVTVTDESLAQIIRFGASPSIISAEAAGEVTIIWETDMAKSVQLAINQGPFQEIPASGSRTISIGSSTDFTLRVRDEEGRAATRRLSVRFKKVEPVIPTPLDPDNIDPNSPQPLNPPPTTTGGDTGGTTSTTTTSSGRGR